MKGVMSHKMRTVQNPDCIWMQAGVVQKKQCQHDYACASCHYDKAMVRIAERNRKHRQMGLARKGRGGRIVHWKEKMRAHPPGKRPCLHSMKGKIQYRNCMNDYHCGNCEFDQYFDDQHLVHAVIKPIGAIDIHGFKIPQGYYLHPGHAWVKVEENAEVRVGLDDFSARMLGPLDEITAPLIGKSVCQGEKSIHLRRGARTAAVAVPVSGVVTAVNQQMIIEGHHRPLRPYTDGWVMQIHTENLRDSLKSLMIGSESVSFLSEEIDTLYQVIEEECGFLAADGGQLGDDIYGNLPESSWDSLILRFLDR